MMFKEEVVSRCELSDEDERAIIQTINIINALVVRMNFIGADIMTTTTSIPGVGNLCKRDLETLRKYLSAVLHANSLCKDETFENFVDEAGE